MRIEELHLKNFRCFKELDIKFHKSNLAVFIGLNGAGKTAILDAILLLLSNYQEKNKNFYTSDDIYIGSELTENKIIFNLNGNIKTWLSNSNYGEEKNIKNKNIHKNLEEHTFFFAYYKTDKKENYVIKDTLHKTNFTELTEWLKIEEDLENELKLDKKDFNFTNARLDVVRKAIEKFFSNISGANFGNLRIRRTYSKDNKIGTYKDEIEKHRNYLSIQYDDKELKLSQLSDGQRLLIYLIGDISYSLAQFIDFIQYNPDNINEAKELEKKMRNEDVSNVFKINGIVLIDEIELHLHPQWQREVLLALQKTFPNIQFIVTTHSPQVLSRVHRDDIFILKDNQLYQPSSNPVGRDSTDILDEIMEVTKRPEDIQTLSDEYFSLINKNKFEEAQKVREQLLVLVEDKKLDEKDPIFIRADGILARKQLLKK
jgi:predicted ATP-binding protein involved in virulence